MSARYDMITKVKEELKNQLKATINNKEMYKDLLKRLIIQVRSLSFLSCANLSKPILIVIF